MSTTQDELNLRETGHVADPVDERDIASPVPISTNLPISVDLRKWCTPIDDQGAMKSCTAHAAVALVEYYETRASGQCLNASRLFLYKVTRNLMKNARDEGANSRTTMKALAAFGVPPEEYWPYDDTKLYEEPPAFCYALATRYRAKEYHRLDVQGVRRDVLLQHIKSHLAADHPLMFSFMLYEKCFTQSFGTGKIPFPSDSDTVFHGHTVAAVGYDDTVIIKNTEVTTGREAVGAVLFRNSYGTRWSIDGYGWLPYDYILNMLSYDWWVLMKQEWLNVEVFGDKK